MSDRAVSLQPAAAPRVQYRPFDPTRVLSADVLAAVAFGNAPSNTNDPRIVRVKLNPLRGGGLVEVWHANGPVRLGRAGAIRYATDADYLFGVLEIDERTHGGIAGAAAEAYAAIRAFLLEGSHPHLLRMWNHFDAINRGEGDAERYREFCTGRAAGLGDWLGETYPAATAVGRRDGDPTLQVFWLAGRVPGVALDNPRQVNPYRYPRAYGPTSPQFSRAMLASSELVMVSGTASIVGHASHHRGDLDAQLEESLANLRSVLQRASVAAPNVPPQLTRESLLKVYLREASEVERVAATLKTRLPEMPCLILEADICRKDLLVEVDCLHAAAGA